MEQRFPELPERLADQVGVRPEVDRVGRKAGRLVRLEREQVKLDPAQEPLAVDRRQPLQVNVVVPVRRAEAELVDAVAQNEVTTAAANRLEPQRRHPPSLLPCRSSPDEAHRHHHDEGVRILRPRSPSRVRARARERKWEAFAHPRPTADIADLSALEAMLSSPSPEVAAAMEAHGVVQPITVYVEA